MTPQPTDDRPTTWLMVAAFAFATITAALDGQNWSAVGFGAIGAAVLLRALRLSDRSGPWKWVGYLLLAFSIGLYIVRLTLRLRGNAA
jgi:hypothetical protein